MSNFYHVTAHKPTGVDHCVAGSFTSDTHFNLLVAKSNILEIYLATPVGIQLVQEVTIYGDIALMLSFRPAQEKKDLLFIITCRYNAMILELIIDETTEECKVLTRAYGYLEDKSGRPSRTGIIGAIDPSCRLICLRLYDGLLKLIRLPETLDKEHNFTLESFNKHIQEHEIISLAFLDLQQNYQDGPVLSILYKSTEGRHFKSYHLPLRSDQEESLTYPLHQDYIDSESNLIISVPLPYSGMLIIGQQTITYHRSGENCISVGPPAMKNGLVFICHAKIDDLRYLVGDVMGTLYMVCLEKNEDFDDSIKNISLVYLGETSTAECIAYIDNSVVFIGSRLGDSELIRLSEQKTEKGEHITHMQSFQNIGPIINMTIVDIDQQGQGELVTCSGAQREGSIKIIRSGIGIHESASSEIEGIRGIWTLKVNSVINGQILGKEKDTHLILSFLDESKVLELHGEELNETDLSGFETSYQTLFCGNVPTGIIQVTTQSVNSIMTSASSGTERINSWAHPNGKTITLASCNQYGQILLAAGSEIFYLETTDDGVKEISNCKLDFEVACLDISSLDGESKSSLAVVGLWTDISTSVLKIPSLEVLYNEKLGGEIIPRSILIVVFEGTPYILCALGDGGLLYYNLQPKTGTLVNRKQVTLGTLPTVLKPFKTETCWGTSGRTLTTTSVFACSDRPTVIFSSNGKLVFSNVNLREVNHICSLDSAKFPNHLAIYSGDTLLFGTIDEIQKMHIRSFEVRETPRRICHQQSTGVFAVLMMKHMYPPSEISKHKEKTASDKAKRTSSSNPTLDVPQALEVTIWHMVVFDQKLMEPLHAHRFHDNEYGQAILSAKLNGVDYLVVGTAHVRDEDPEPKSGRIVIFRWNGETLEVIHEREMKGAVYSMEQHSSNRIVVSVNSMVRMYEWMPDNELRHECTYYHNILALYLKVKSDFILVGDLMKSMTLLRYNQVDHSLEAIARDESPAWLSAIELVDDDTVLGAESNGNLFTAAKGAIIGSGSGTLERSAGASLDDRQRLAHKGCFGNGYFINVFVKGSIVMKQEPQILGPDMFDGIFASKLPVGITSMKMDTSSVDNDGSATSKDVTSAGIDGDHESLSSSITHLDTQQMLAVNPIMYGSTTGAIGLLVQIPNKKVFQFLTDLEKRMADAVPSPGKIEHSFWRSFRNERKVNKEATGFVDGDLIESFLDLTKEKQSEITSGLEVTTDSGKKAVLIDDVIKLVEELSRLH